MNNLWARLPLVICAATAAAASWLPPENLGATLNTAYDEWYPVVAPDRGFMVFTSNRPGGQGDLDLWRSRRTAGVWQAPENIGTNVNTASWESGHFITADGRYLYFASGCAGSQGYGDIWYSELTNGVPGAKTNLGAPVNSASLDCCPVITADGNTLYFGSDRAGGYGMDDIWVSTKSGGAWGQPVNLGAAVNTSGNECPRWVSADGATLVFIGVRSAGYGLHDLWYTKKTGGAWGTPVNLGANVNSAAEDWGASFDCNHGALGGVIYFGSGRAGGAGGMDLWRSTDGESVGLEDKSLGEMKAAYE